MTLDEEFTQIVTEDMNTGPCGIFVGRLLHAATVAHFMHLSTRSYAAHMALGAFYGELPALVDAIAESYQSRYGIITNYPMTYTYAGEEPLDFLMSVRDFISQIREQLPQDTELQNDIDTIVTLVNSTIYKLKFLS